MNWHFLFLVDEDHRSILKVEYFRKPTEDYLKFVVKPHPFYPTF